jgi:hypothetical protein
MTTALSLAFDALAQQTSDSQVEKRQKKKQLNKSTVRLRDTTGIPWLFAHRHHRKLWRSVRDASFDIL